MRALVDAGAWTFALYFATLLRLDFKVEQLSEFAVFWLLPVAIGVQWSVGYVTRLYRDGQVYGSFDEISALARTVSAAGLCLIVLNVIPETQLAPRSAVVGGTLIAFLIMGGTRYVWRRRRDAAARQEGGAGERVLVFGAGDGGQRIVRAMIHDPSSHYLPVGLLDDDPAKAHLSVAGVPVVGTKDDLAEVAKRLDARLLLVAVPSANAKLVRDLAKRAAHAHLSVRVLPSVHELLDGQVRVVDIRAPNETDLLGRHQVNIDLGAAASAISGRRVLVTGGGGSIGSELCRQIASFGPERLLIVDRDESALHAVQLSISGRALLDSDDLVLLDIRDRTRVHRLFEIHRPDVVFHAAALKHLPLLEAHPCEAVKGNIWGTLAVLDAAASVGVDRFVNISTDKAANPASTLGYSKRIAERLTAWTALHSSGTYMSVRFGNVLGSRGSVLTTFREQIAQGGPLTVTHPDVTRFFMTVEEAVQLVIEASGLGRDAEVLVLDMGEPVKIAEVARRLAESTHRPIEIVFTGLRPGEKMHEDLFATGEIGLPSSHPSIQYVDAPPLDPALVRDIDPTCADDSLRSLLADLCVAESEPAAGPTRLFAVDG